jgi:enoyl-CoA hydratase
VRSAAASRLSVRVERRGAVYTVVLHRPEAKNAVDRPTAEALAEAFRAFAADDEARVAVLWGDGGTFCAGADLKAIGTSKQNRVELTGDGPMGPTRMRCNKPVIAAIEGFAVAGGLELAAWCDLRVVAEDATLGCFERRWGVPLIDGGTVRLPQIVGLGRALDLILTGRAVGAEEALAMGLATRVVTRGRAREVAELLGEELARFPQACLVSDLRSTYDALDRSLEEALVHETQLGVASLESDGRAGAARFAGGSGRHGKPDE